MHSIFWLSLNWPEVERLPHPCLSGLEHLLKRISSWYMAPCYWESIWPLDMNGFARWPFLRPNHHDKTSEDRSFCQMLSSSFIGTNDHDKWPPNSFHQLGWFGRIFSEPILLHQAWFPSEPSTKEFLLRQEALHSCHWQAKMELPLLKYAQTSVSMQIKR